jgi:hypothetical protein
MADPPPGAQVQGGGIVVPDELRQKFPDLIELILASESMNDEERQYWINILPIMTPEQVENLRGILVNEREQLAAIDRKYSKEVQQLGQKQFLAHTEEERRKRRLERESKETEAGKEEKEHAEDVLRQINEQS